MTAAGYAVCFGCAAVTCYSPLANEPPAACERCSLPFEVDSHTADPLDAGHLSTIVALSLAMTQMGIGAVRERVVLLREQADRLERILTMAAQPAETRP